MLTSTDNQFYKYTGKEPELEAVAVSILNEKIEFIFSKLIESSKAGIIKPKLNSGTFYKACSGAGFNKKQGRRILIFLIKIGKIKNRGKAGLEVMKL